MKKAPPATHTDVVKNESRARVSLIAADDAWRQNSPIYINVPQRYILYIDEWLSLAGNDRVKEAARISIAPRLVLLLRTNVNSPPDGSPHLQVLVDNIGNDASGARRHSLGNAWIGLHVDGLEGVIESRVTERHIVDTVVLVAGWDRAHRQANPKPDVEVSHYDIFCTVGVLVVLVTRFDGYGVVIVGNIEALDQDIASMGIHSIGVEREHWERCIA